MAEIRPRLRLELADAPGATDFLDELARLLGATRPAGECVHRLPAARPEGVAPEIELVLVSGETRLGFVDAPGGPLPFSFEAPVSAPARVGESRSIARDVEAELLELDRVRETLGDVIRGVDHLGLNLPARTHPRRAWLAALHAITDHARLIPFDAEAEIAFVVPTTSAERRDGPSDPDVPRKPKLELVRDPFLETPMVGFAVDTDLSLGELATRFPEPRGVWRPGNEAFFRSVLLAHPFEGLLLCLDLNSRETSTVEITRLLIDGGQSLPATAEDGGRD